MSRWSDERVTFGHVKHSFSSSQASDQLSRLVFPLERYGRTVDNARDAQPLHPEGVIGNALPADIRSLQCVI